MEKSKLVASILSLTVNEGLEFEKLADTIKNQNPPKFFPVLPKDQNTQLINMILQKYNMKKALNSSEYNFSFNIELLTEVLANLVIQLPKCPNYLPILIFNQYISYIKSDFRVNEMPVLLENLRLIMKFTPIDDYKQYAINAFIDLYNIIPETCTQSEFHQLLSPLFQFISDCTELHPLLFHIVIKMFQMSASYHTNVSSSMFNVVKITIEHFHDKISMMEIDVLIKMLSDQILEFQISVIPLLHTILQHFSNINFDGVLDVATTKIVDAIGKTQPISIGDLSKFSSNEKIEKAFIRHDKPSTQIQNLIDPELLQLINNITQITNAHVDLSNKFILKLIIKLIKSDYSDPYTITNMIVFTQILKCVRDPLVASDAIPTLLKSIIFSPCMDSLEPEKYEIINLLKNEIYTILFYGEPSGILSEFKNLYKRSIHLMFDVIHRAATHQIHISDAKKMEMHNLLSWIWERLSKLEDKQLYHFYLFEFFDFVEFILESDTVMEEFFQYSPFYVFLSQLFHEPLLFTKILDLEVKYMKTIRSNSNDLYNMNVSQQLIKFFFLTIDQNRIHAAIEHIKFLTAIMTINPDSVTVYKEIIFRILQNLPINCTKEDSASFIHLIFNLLAIGSDNLIYSQQIFHKIEQFLEQTFDADIPWFIIHDLLSVCAGKPLPTLKTVFEVKQPKFFGIILRMTKNMKNLHYVVCIIDIICQKYQSTRYSLHNNGIDLLIIDIIKHSESDLLIDLCISVIKKISSSISSAAVVNRFISLLMPVKDKYFPRYQEKVLKFLNEMITDALDQPPCGFVISKNSAPYITGFTADQFRDFSFSIWMYCTTTVSDTVVFSIHDSDKFAICLYMSNGYATIVVADGDSTWEGPLKLQCPVGKWFIVNCSIQFLKSETNSKIIATIGLEGYFIRQLFQYLEFKPGPVILEISNGATTTDNDLLIGPFSIFSPIPEAELPLLFKSNPHQMPKIPKEPFFFMMPRKDGEKISLAVNPPYQLYYKPIKNTQPFSILDVLSARIGYSVLVPLFAEFGFVYEDGRTFDDFGLILINIIKNTLILNNRSQSELDTSHSFEAISYLLSSINSPGHILTFDLYISFFNLSTYITNKYLMKSLFKSIICNFSLWHSSNDQRKIFKHWEQVLFRNYIKIARKCLSFEELMRIVRTFYYYEPVETALISIREIEVDVQEVRRLLIKCAYYVISYKQLDNDITFLGSQILTSVVARQQNELLDLLLAILDLNNLTGEDITKYSSLLMIHSLISTNNLETIEKMFNVMIKMHKKFAINEITLSEQLYMILEELPILLMTNEEFFNIVLKFAKENAEFFSLACYVAQNLGQSFVEKVFTEVDTFPEFAKVHHWTVWPSLAFLTCGSEMRITIIDFLTKCGSDLWLDAFAAIEHIGRSLGISVVQPEHDFISSIAARLLAQEIPNNKKNVDAFLKVVKYFLLLKPHGYTSKYLVKNQAPTLVNIKHENPSYMKQIIANLRSFQGDQSLEKLLDLTIKDLKIQNSLASDLHLIITNPIEKRHFGLLFNSDGYWVDRDIVNMAFEIFNRMPLEEHFGLMTILAGMIIKYNPDIAHKFVNKYIIVINLLPEINVYNHRALMSHKPTFRKADPVTCFNKTQEVLENLSTKDDPVVNFGMNYSNFVAKCNSSAELIVGLSQGEVLRKMFNAATDLLERYSRSKFRYRIEWRKLWLRFIDDGSPWRDCISTKIVKKLRREYTDCLPFGCPMKILSIKVQRKSDRIVARPSNPFYDVLDNVNDEIQWNECSRHDFDPSRDFAAELINLDQKKSCNIFVSNISLFIYQPNKTFFQIMFDSISSVLLKPWRRVDSAVEVATKFGESFLFNILNNRLPQFISYVKSAHLKNLELPIQVQPNEYPRYFADTKLTEKWVNAQISNFEYLIALNRFSGRTFHSTLQYPIMPWVLSDYIADEFPMNNSSLIRNFNMKMGQNLPEKTVDNLHVAKMLSRLQPFNTLTKENFNSVKDEWLNSTVNEIPPEFFYSPEIFEGVELPPWARTPMDFVYYHRKNLETEEVSQQLHKWIDATFGVGQKLDESNIPPKIIFKNKHPQRNKRVNTQYFKFVEQFTQDKLICAFVLHITDKNISAVAFNEKSEMIKVTLSEKGLNTSIDKISAPLGRDRFAHYVSSKPNTYLVNQTDSDTISIVSDSNVSELNMDSFVSCMDANDMYSVVADNNAIVHLYLSDNLTRTIFKLQTYTQSINEIIVSKNFHSIICSTVDNTILIISITKKSLAFVVSLGNFHAKKVIVTQAFGFIIAIGKGIIDGNVVRKIFIISCNGQILKEFEIGNKISAVSTFISNDGFDYVTLIDSFGKVFVFEAYCPETMKQIGTIGSRILGMKSEQGRVVTVTADGLLTILPFNIY